MVKSTNNIITTVHIYTIYKVYNYYMMVLLLVY